MHNCWEYNCKRGHGPQFQLNPFTPYCSVRHLILAWALADFKTTIIYCFYFSINYYIVPNFQLVSYIVSSRYINFIFMSLIPKLSLLSWFLKLYYISLLIFFSKNLNTFINLFFNYKKMKFKQYTRENMMRWAEKQTSTSMYHASPILNTVVVRIYWLQPYIGLNFDIRIKLSNEYQNQIRVRLTVRWVNWSIRCLFSRTVNLHFSKRIGLIWFYGLEWVK